MNPLRAASAFLILGAMSACISTPVIAQEVRSEEAVRTEILDVLFTQQAAWSRGDIPGFMEGYWKSPDLRFASGGAITHGWQETHDRYIANYGDGDPERMGQLKFSELVVELAGDEDALVFGRWQIKLANGAPWGLFTLHFRKIDGDWLIVSDHTSSAGQ